MKHNFTLTVQQFEPVIDREMGAPGGYRVTCEEYGLMSSATTLKEALYFMTRLLTTRIKLGEHSMSESQMPRTDEAEKPEIMYQSACSGLWYENEAAAGTLKAIRIGSRIYAFPNIDPIITELTATRARLAELEGIAEQAICRFGCTCGEFGMCPLCSDVIKRYEAYKEGK